MKRLFIAALAAVLLVAFGCGAKSDKSDKSADGPTAFDVANNYIVNLMTQSMMNDGDSIPLLKAVEISEGVDVSALTGMEKILYYGSRAQLFGLLHRVDDAIDALKSQMMCYEVDSPERLSFLGLMALNEGKNDSASYYFNRGMEVCDAKLKGAFNSSYAMKNIEIAYYLKGENQAKALFDSYVAEHPEDQVLGMMRECWTGLVQMYELSKDFKGNFDKISQLAGGGMMLEDEEIIEGSDSNDNGIVVEVK
ncbi:MAG: hypothetical protein OSJ37_04905 [Muribaculaceae bacterium]|jgi:hypothetical protein|nr:hypothetical protein [Muribaculaceae bacterium]